MKTSLHRISIILFALICFNYQLSAYSEKNLLQKTVESVNLQEVLIMNQEWVQYPAYTDRNGWDILTGHYKSKYIERGEKLLDFDWIVIKATDYLEFERSGSRKHMEDPYGKNNEAVVDLMMAELAEGKGRFIDQLINGVFNACEMTSWSIAAHQIRQSDKRSLPIKDEHIIELTSGDMASVYAWIYYFFRDEFDKVNPTISKRLRLELEDRMLKPFLEKDFWWMGFNYRPGVIINNWNPWCNSNVLQCFMLLENDEKRLEEAVFKTIKSVDQFINYSNYDGACEEGPSYWKHAAAKLYDYLQILYDATNGKISLFDEPMIKSMGEYIYHSYIGNNWVVNFADASAKLSVDEKMVFRYGYAVNSDKMMGFAKLLADQRKNDYPPKGRDIFRTLQTLLYKDKFSNNNTPYVPSQNIWYPETQFCYLANKQNIFLAAKGGYNNESHNHNDIGTFILYVDQTPIIIDVGVGTYTRQTFSKDRYSIWTMQSQYHNLPTINGFQQSFGYEFKADNVKYNPKNQSFSLDISKAYPAEASISKWIRSYQLKNDRVIISDNYTIDNLQEKNKIHFLTWGNIDVSKPGVISINVDEINVDLEYDLKKFNIFVEQITLDDSRLSNVWGKEISRISLEEKTTQKNGVLKYTIIKK